MDSNKKQLIIDFINKGKVEIDPTKLDYDHDKEFYAWALKPKSRENRNLNIVCNISAYSIGDITISPTTESIGKTSVILDHEFFDDDSLLELKLLTETKIVFITIITENFGSFLKILK